MPPLSLDRLTEAQLEELAVQLLVADKGSAVKHSDRIPGALGAGVVMYDFGDSGRWIIKCKTDSEALPAAILQLPSYKQIHQADHALLVTTKQVPLSLRKEVAEPLGVEVWDRLVLQLKLSTHPEVTRARARSTRASGGETRMRALELHNFRGIRDMQIEFADPVTLLVGLNGAGKSAILEALAKLLSWPARRIFDRTGGMHFGEYDIHDEASESWINLEAVLEGTLARWSLRGHRSRANQSSLLDLKQAVQPIRDALKESPEASIPLFVYYPVNRAVLDIPRRVRKSEKLSQSMAHDAALGGGEREFRRFFSWFRQREDVENEHRSRKRGGYRDPQLVAVRRAVESIMPGFKDLRIQRTPMRMLVRKDERDLVIDQLSDGEKCLLAMTGDLARRLALANPAMKDPLQARGIVLIDEIDLHLHPTWQRQVIPALAGTFPHCQFVASTHSPQVIGSVQQESVKLLEDGRLVEKLSGGERSRRQIHPVLPGDDLSPGKEAREEATPGARPGQPFPRRRQAAEIETKGQIIRSVRRKRWRDTGHDPRLQRRAARPATAQPRVTLRTPRASSRGSRRLRRSPWSTMTSSSTEPPQPSAFLSSLHQVARSSAPRPSFSMHVASLPPRPLRSMRTTARAGPLGSRGGPAGLAG
jgi:predicted ATP-binding protein involved in virulence